LVLFLNFLLLFFAAVSLVERMKPTPRNCFRYIPFTTNVASAAMNFASIMFIFDWLIS